MYDTREAAHSKTPHQYQETNRPLSKRNEQARVVIMQEEKISRSVMKQDEEDKAAGTVEEEEEVVLPGFRFHPTDEELVGFYLRRKVEKKIISIGIIKQIDIYKYDPWDLPKVSTAGEKEWYFFCLRERKYRNSVRPNRVTGTGFWKATGIDKPINSGDGRHKCIGLKKSLVYYKGSAGKGTKTDWMMHEFRLPSESMQEAEIWTICRIFKKDVTYKKNLVWRESLPREQTQILNTDSSSKSSSFESNCGDTYYKKHFGSSTVHQGEKLAKGHLKRPVESVADQWNTTAQPPLTTSHLEISSPIPSELYKDANNWDELGRIMESVMDPAMVYEYRRYT